MKGIFFVAHLPGALSCMKVNMLGLGFSLMSFFDILYHEHHS